MAAAPAPEQQRMPERSVLFPGRALAFGLFPIALLPPGLLPWAEFGLVRPVCLYLLLALLWGTACGVCKTTRAWNPGWPVWLFLAALLALQGTSAYSSAAVWGASLAEAAGTCGHLLLQVANLLLYALGLRLLCGVPGGPPWLVRGAAFSCIILLAVCALQLAWLLTGPEVRDWLAQGIALSGPLGGLGETVSSLHAALTPLLAWASRWLEARAPWFEALPASGGHTLTMLRVHGVFATAADLAVTLAVAYTPLLVGGLTVAGIWGRRLYALLAAAVLMALFGARTLTAVAACLFVLIWFGRVLWKPGGRLRALFVSVLVAGLSVGSLYYDESSRRLAARVLEPGAAALPEEIVARELWALVRAHPWTGVGYGWSSPYVISGQQYLRAMRAEDLPELRAWREDARDVPTPALLLEFLAVFGIPLTAGVAVSFPWLWWRLRRLPGAGPGQRFALAACAPYSMAVAVFSLSDADWTNPLLWLPYCGLWAMAGVWERAGGTAPARGKAAAPATGPVTGKSAGQTSSAKEAGQAPAGKKAEPLISDSPSRPFTLSGGG